MAVLFFASCKNEKKALPSDNEMELVKDVTIEGLAQASFGVRGNCSMCKSTIEDAATSIHGVVTANWHINAKKVDVSFDESKTDVMAIHNAIAASGYDTEKVSADEVAYKAVPECCKYERDMEMNQSE